MVSAQFPRFGSARRLGLGRGSACCHRNQKTEAAAVPRSARSPRAGRFRPGRQTGASGVARSGTFHVSGISIALPATGGSASVKPNAKPAHNSKINAITLSRRSSDPCPRRLRNSLHATAPSRKTRHIIDPPGCVAASKRLSVGHGRKDTPQNWDSMHRLLIFRMAARSARAPAPKA